MILNFDEFLNENSLTDITPALKKSLDELGKGFENDKEIYDAIIFLGFEDAKTGRETSADYVFLDPTAEDDVSYQNGYVRSISKSKSFFNRGVGIGKGPSTKSRLETPRERLLFILRRAMKEYKLFDEWKKSGKPAKEFIHSMRGSLHGKKYGI